MPAPDLRDLEDPELFLNRELSQLEFNARVLEQAVDPDTPLLERLRFLTICSTNLDEFFEVRVAGLKQQLAFGLARTGPDGLTPVEVLRRVGDRAQQLVAEQYRVLNDVLLPELAANGIEVLRRDEWTVRQQRWIERHFKAQVLARSDADSDRPRRIPSRGHPEQEPQLRGDARRPRRLSVARARSPSCRCRAPCRG